MSQPMPALSKLSDLTNGQRGDFFALLADKSRGVTRENRPYYQCRFRDSRRVVSHMAWEDDRWFELAEREWQVGKVYKLRAVFVEHERYGPQIDLINLRLATADENIDPAELVESSRHDLVKLWAELRTVATENIQDAPLRAFTLALLDRYAEPLQRLPLTRDRAYSYRGGLLEHLVSVSRVAVDLARHYALAHPALRPPLNLGLVAAGAVLHELGKVREFSDDALLPTPTIAGRLTGPLVLGRDLLREAAAEHSELSADLIQMLEHILLSPLYPADGTGPRWSLVPEGLLIQYADDLDLKMALYVRCLERDGGAGPFTERDPVLGRQLFKGRTS